MQVIEQHAESLVKLAKLLQMKIEVLGMCVVSVVCDFHDSGAAFQQCLGQDTVAAEGVLAISLQIFG